MKTQTERVLALSKRFNGVCQADLLLPDVADGGAPITRVAARLWDLEQEGYEFEAIGTRKRCKVFRLIEAERSAGARRDEGGLSAAVDEHAADSPAQPGQGVSASLSPEPLFVVGKAELGYADQGELDAA